MDSRHIYLHSFDDKLCRHIHLRNINSKHPLEWQEEEETDMSDEEVIDFEERTEKRLKA